MSHASLLDVNIAKSGFSAGTPFITDKSSTLINGVRLVLNDDNIVDYFMNK